MNLVFQDYIKFLKDNNVNLGLKEGYYWLDRQIIKAYDKEGNLHKVARLKINDDLSINYEPYQIPMYVEFETWQETVKRNIDRLKEIESESLELIRNRINTYEGYEPIVLSSGGKDSSVVTHLARKVIDNPLVIFNNTSLDCTDTYLHIKKEPNLKIINPSEGFYQWRERNNFLVTRISRACCQIFKEKSMVDDLDDSSKNVFMLGMRNQESNTRSGYGDDWRNNKWGTRQWEGILPIRKWTEVDVWLYIMWQNIDINPKYKKGYSRVGCAIACPFYTKSTWVLDKYWYPKMYDRWHKIVEEDFINNKKAPTMNCTLSEYHLNWNGGMVRDEATEEVVKEFSEMYGIDINLAAKYFDKKCSCCGKKLKKNDVALTLKLYGRHVSRYKCIKCLAKDFDLKMKDLKKMAEEFKSTGCELF